MKKCPRPHKILIYCQDYEQITVLFDYINISSPQLFMCFLLYNINDFFLIFFMTNQNYKLGLIFFCSDIVLFLVSYV